MCRACGRAKGVEALGQLERERERVERRRRALEGQRVVIVPRPSRTCVFDGVEFEIAWDGTIGPRDCEFGAEGI